MAEYNEIEDIVIPDSPKVEEGQQYHIYVPIATYDQAGIAKFNSQFFEVIEGRVTLKTEFLNGKADVIDGKILTELLPLDSDTFVVKDGLVYISDDYFEAHKEIYVLDNESELPSEGKEDVIFIIDGLLYYWNGSKHVPISVTQSVDLAGITRGDVEDSLSVFDGKASKQYSISGGTNDTNALGELKDYLGSTSLSRPVADSPLSFTYGIGTKTQAVAANAIGVNSIAGVKGYYWWSVDGNTFELSTTRKSLVSSRVKPSSLDWEIGDYICVVNNNKYPFVAQITDINRNDMTITVNALPKVKVNGSNVAFCDVYQYTAYVGMTPEDMSIFAVKRATNSRTNNIEHTVRDGTVELAWASTVVGVLCIGAGMAAHVVGYSNIAHDFGFVSGRENMCGYASLVTGSKNVDRGLYNLISGHDNYINTTISNAVIGGQHNKVYADNSVAFGYNNEVMAGSASSLLVGDGLKAQMWCQTGVGRYNDHTLTKTDLFFVGNGSSDKKRGNAFRVTSNGDVIISRDLVITGTARKSSGAKYVSYLPVWSGSLNVPAADVDDIYDTNMSNIKGLSLSNNYCFKIQHFAAAEWHIRYSTVDRISESGIDPTILTFPSNPNIRLSVYGSNNVLFIKSNTELQVLEIIEVA